MPFSLSNSSIGAFPSNWIITRLKYTLAEPMKYGATETGVDYDENLFRYIRITDIDSNGKFIIQPQRYDFFPT